MSDWPSKRDRLRDILARMPRVAVAFSGGVDSAVVAKAAFDAKGEDAVAITADSPSVPRADLEDARSVAQCIGIKHRIVRTDEFHDEQYLRNDGRRCYFCKSELYARIERLLPELGHPVVVSGANLDDRGDYRPGLIAAAEHAIRHPLQEAGCTKADVRAMARDWNLPVWDKPASPCLSSRIAPGVAVTIERTTRIEQAEMLLHDLGLRECRVRLHDGELARIEVPATEIARLADERVRTSLSARLHELGFKFVTLDLDGFRSGSLNDLIDLGIRQRLSQELTHDSPSVPGRT